MESFAVDISALDELASHHEPTFQHSHRVSRMVGSMARVAEIPGVSPEKALLAGLLHDIGKITIPIALLNKTANFTEEDYLIMETHVTVGWDMLCESNAEIAEIVLRHHRYGTRPYPQNLPPVPEGLDLIAIEKTAQLIALADYYDALTTRKNDRNGIMTSHQMRERYRQDNANQLDLIYKFEEAGLLTYPCHVYTGKL